MFTYAFITGVKKGWLDGKAYAPAAKKAWIALVSTLTNEIMLQRFVLVRARKTTNSIITTARAMQVTFMVRLHTFGVQLRFWKINDATTSCKIQDVVEKYYIILVENLLICLIR